MTMPRKSPTKAQLEQQIRDLQNQVADRSKTNEALIRSGQVASSARRLAQEAANEPVYEVQSIVDSTVTAEVSDQLGNKKRVMWDKKGSVQLMTSSQIAQIQEHTRFFGDGILYAPEIIPTNDNVVLNIEEFIAALDINGIRARISLITSVDVLYMLYHNIESKRFIIENNDIKEVPLDPKAQIVLLTVMERLSAYTGINFSTTGSE
jgi:hypothetical protein